MENFSVYNPTHLHFGKNCLTELPQAIAPLAKKVLLIYGKGSAVRNGYYQKVVEKLRQAKIEIIEFAGIKSNPVITDVDAAAQAGIENRVDAILALGGGSVIDSAKIAAIAIAQKNKGWDIVTQKVETKKALPLVAVLTVAATGTEMNPIAVVQNDETKQKFGHKSTMIFPRHSFLDPDFTTSLPANYTAYGIVDLIAHALEAYFGNGQARLADRFVEAIISEAMYYAPLLMADLKNYDYRANIMWAATCALNGMTAWGRAPGGDWGVHAVGHTLSVLYDTPHGASLSIAYPAWLRLQCTKIPERITFLGKQIFGTAQCIDTIQRFESFFKSLNAPTKLQEIGIAKDKHNEILELLNQNKASGIVHPLDETDRQKIVDFMFAE